MKHPLSERAFEIIKYEPCIQSLMFTLFHIIRFLIGEMRCQGHCTSYELISKYLQRTNVGEMKIRRDEENKPGQSSVLGRKFPPNK